VLTTMCLRYEREVAAILGNSVRIVQKTLGATATILQFILRSPWPVRIATDVAHSLPKEGSSTTCSTSE